LVSLNGSVGSFLAHDVRRPFPKAHPGGFSGTLAISLLFSENAYSVQLSSPGGGLTLSPGDYIGFEYGAGGSRALHMIQSPPQTLSAGVPKSFDVFPAIRPGATVGAAITVNRASCEMILEPGHQAPALRDLVASSLSFSAIQIL
jgi:hypothetical protein